MNLLKSLTCRIQIARPEIEASVIQKVEACRVRASKFGNIGHKMRCLMKNLLQQIRDIETKQKIEMRKKKEKFYYLLNGLAKSLGESFSNCKNKSTSELLVAY